jgi:Tol biopolymer transport system component
MSATGQNVTNLSGNRTGNHEPTWAPQGRRIAFIHAGHVWIMRSDGSRAHRIESNATPESSPSWSPDGSTIAATRCCRGEPGSKLGVIVGMSPDGTHHRILFGANGTDNSGVVSGCGIGLRQPDWYPTGRILGFTRTLEEQDGGGEDIDVRHLVTGKQVGFAVAHEGPVDGSFNADPSFAPDGSAMAYVSINADTGICVPSQHPERYETIRIGAKCPPSQTTCSDDYVTKGFAPAWQPVLIV